MLVCAVLIAFLLPTESRTYMVDDNGFADYKAIGQAVAAAGNGDTIYIKSGVYSESITLNKSLKLMPLIGEKGDIVLLGDGKETGVTITANGCSIEGLTIKNFKKAGIEILSKSNIIKSSKFENDNPAILIEGASQNLISDNFMIDCRGGVALKYNSQENAITKNEIDGGLISIYLDDAFNSSVLSNYLTGGSIAAILIANSSIGKIIDNMAVRSNMGIYLQNATDMELNNNSIRGVESGITLESSEDNSILRCRVDNSSIAFGLGLSANNTIAENLITDAADTAIDLGYSDDNVVAGNQISKGERGILMAYSSGNKLQGNKLKEIRHGLYVDGESFEDYNNSIDESNEIDGKPIVYICGQSSGLIQHRDLSHLTLAFCKNFVVEDNTISNDALSLLGSDGNKIVSNNLSRCYGGMFLLNSKTNQISRNRIVDSNYSGIFLVGSESNIVSENDASRNNQMGISLLSSANNTIQNNSFIHNYDTGIWLNLSNENKIFENNASGSPLGLQAIYSNGNSIYWNDFANNLRVGILLSLSKDNRVYENNISKNPLGMQLAQSSGNEIYHNNFLGNKEQAEDRGGENRWDLGNVTGGNYWSDHTAIGNPSTGWPKLIRGAKKDNYPFQDMNGWLKAKDSARNLTALLR